jgi:hypothetical protein
MEHIQMHPTLKKGTKISIILAILVEFLVISLFHETKWRCCIPILPKCQELKIKNKKYENFDAAI